MEEPEIIQKIVDGIILGEWHQSIYWAVENSDRGDKKKRKIFADLVESILTEYKRHSLTDDEADATHGLSRR